MSSEHKTGALPVLAYLALPQSYEPSPETSPIEFLQKHIRELPPHMLMLFSTTTAPRERAVIPVVKNRRFKYAETKPPELALVNAQSTWPALWEGWERPGKDQGRDEKEWADKEFMDGGTKQQVGKLGALLGDYEEERESERVRAVRRRRAEYIESLPEEDEESDESGEEPPVPEDVPIADREVAFLRSIKEHFIYGRLEVRSRHR